MRDIFGSDCILSEAEAYHDASLKYWVHSIGQDLNAFSYQNFRN